MIIGYARVSTDQQHLDMQQEALTAAGCTKIYSDIASGAKASRPELDKCLKFLQSGDILCVWKLDRLGRTLHQLVNLIHEFESKGIGFKVLTAPIDTTTSQGRLIFGIFASLAQFERELIKERVTAGIVSAKARGIKFGRPRVGQDILDKALDDVASGMPAYLAAKKYGISKSKLYQVLP